MKELSDFLLHSKDTFQRHEKTTNQVADKLKERITKECGPNKEDGWYDYWWRFFHRSYLLPNYG